MWSWIKAHKFILIILIVLGGIAWIFFSQQKKTVYDEYTVTRENIKDTLELSGKVRAKTMVTLRFPTGGLVTYLGPQEGESVKKWQTLASLDTRQLKKIMEEKLNLYAMQRGAFEQTIDDTDNSVPAGDLARSLKRILEKNQYQLDNTVKDVEYQDLSMKLAHLVSPIDGILVQSPLTTSNVQVLPTDAWTIVDPSSLYLSADLDETDLKRVSVGQKVIVVLDAYPDKEIQTLVSSLSYSPKETTTGTAYEVKIALSDMDMQGLRLGLNGTANVVLSEKEQVLALPASALTHKNDKTYVLIKSDKKYSETEVQTGIEHDGMVEIQSGLQEHDHVYAQK